ncbi:MAG: DUF4114 domain-containing protein [Pseudomonadota bacterium]|nr:DUF4114 domain-containing protein [Pseudomonadota bacterium]
MKRSKLLILAGAGLLFSSFSDATVLHYRSDVSDPSTPGTIPYYSDVETLLTLEDMNNPAYETAASSFIVGGTGSIDLTFTFLRDTGSYNGIFAFYDMAALSSFTIGSSNWIDAAIASSTVVFNDNTDAIGSQSSFIVEAGTELGFMLWTNGFGSLTLFSFEEANPDGSDAGTDGDDMILSFTGNDKTIFTFEDVIGGDYDFTDLSFSIDTALIAAPPPGTSSPVSEPATGALALLSFSLCLFRRKRR